MKLIGLFSLSLFLLAITVHAQDPLDALTGVYTGTLVRERSVSVVGATPPKIFKSKQTTRVGGIGYIPTGNTRATIKIILPGEHVLDVGVDKEFVLDFEQSPPTVTVSDGAANNDLTGAFPTITVQGKVVTVIIQATITGDGIRTTDIRTLKILRTRP